MPFVFLLSLCFYHLPYPWHPRNPWFPRFNNLKILTWQSHFPRNARPNLTEYLSERPDMNSHDEEPKRPKPTKSKGKPKYEKSNEKNNEHHKLGEFSGEPARPGDDDRNLRHRAGRLRPADATRPVRIQPARVRHRRWRRSTDRCL